MWSTCCWVLNDIGVAKVNEIAFTNACFTLQALTLEINEEPRLHPSSGVANNSTLPHRMGNKTHVLCPPQWCQNVIAQTSKGDKRDYLRDNG